jgi:hypothetical protein
MEHENDVLSAMGGVVKKDKHENFLIAFGSTDIDQKK